MSRLDKISKLAQEMQQGTQTENAPSANDRLDRITRLAAEMGGQPEVAAPSAPAAPTTNVSDTYGNTQRKADRETNKIVSPIAQAVKGMTAEERNARYNELNKEYKRLKKAPPNGGTQQQFADWYDRLSMLATEMTLLKNPLSGKEKLELASASTVGAIPALLENISDTIVGGGANLLADAITEGKAIFTGNDESKAADWLKQQAEKVYATDGLMGAGSWGERTQQKYDERITDTHKAINNFAGSGTQMIGSLALGNIAGAAAGATSTANALTGAKAARAAQVTQAMGKAALGVGAAGSSTKQALSEGAEIGDAIAYGQISGLLEAAIESIAGGIPGMGRGKLGEAVDAVMDLAKRSGFISSAIDLVGEGAEEAISAFLQPYAQRMFYNPEAKNATLKELGEAFASGVALSAIMQGAAAGANALTSRGLTAQTAADVAQPQNAPAGELNGTEAALPTEVAPAPAVEAVNAGETQGLPEGTGAASNPFATETKQSRTQSNTLAAMDERLGVPEESRSELTYDTVSEQENLSNAGTRLENDYDGEVEVLSTKTNWSGEETDMAMMVLEDLAADAKVSGDWSKYNDWRKLIKMHGTEAGRSLQAYAKYSRQTGDGIISEAAEVLENAKIGTDTNAVMNEVSELATQYDKAVASNDANTLADIIRKTSRIRRTGTFFKNRFSKNMEWALERVIANGDVDFLKNHASAGIVAMANDHVSAKTSDIVMTIRRNAMLSKFSTTMRNLISNNVFDIQDSLSRDISVPLDILLSKMTGTRSVAVDKGWFSKEKRQGSLDGLAKSMLEVGLDVDAEGNLSRWENGSNRTFHMSGGVVSRLLSTWEKQMGYLLTTTDQFQKGGIQAEVRRGLEQLAEQGGVEQDAIDELAQNEALYRTFQDDTVLSQTALKVRNAFGRVGEFVLPFARVPSNLASRALEYSPVGLAKGVVDIARVMKSAKNGTLTPAQQAKAVQQIGRGMNGTALLVGATALALQGVLKVADNGVDDKDKDKAALEKQGGIKGTQLNVSAIERWADGGSTDWQDGDVLVSVEFLDPFNAILTTGSLLAEDIQSEDGASVGSLLKRTLEGTVQSIMDLPMMDPLMQASNAFQYSDAETMGGKLLDAAYEWAAGQASSFVPNFVKGIAQSFDPYQRDAYTQDNPLLQAWDNIKAGIPGARNTLPTKTDSYGDPLDAQTGVLGWLNNNILPGTITKYNKPRAEVTNILDDLYEKTGNAGVYPSRSAPSSINHKGEKYELGTEEQRAFQQTSGNAFADAVKALMDSKDYNLHNDVRASEIIADIATYANAVARKEYLAKQGKIYEMTGEAATVENAMEAAKRGIDLAEYYAIKDGFNSVTKNADGTEDADDAGTNNRQFAQWLSDAGWLTQEQKDVARELFIDWQFIPGNTQRYDELTGLNFTSEKANSVVDTVGALGEDPSYSAITNAIRGMDNLSDSEKWDAVISYNSVSKGDKDKAATAKYYGVSLGAFSQMLSAVDNVKASGDGSVNSAEEVRKAVDMVNADNKTKAILFAMYSTSEQNPYGNYQNKSLNWQYAK